MQLTRSCMRGGSHEASLGSPRNRQDLPKERKRTDHACDESDMSLMKNIVQAKRVDTNGARTVHIETWERGYSINKESTKSARRKKLTDATLRTCFMTPHIMTMVAHMEVHVRTLTTYNSMRAEMLKYVEDTTSQ